MELKGNDFEVAKLPTVHAGISPDLRLRANPKLAELTGSVHIPRARVKLKQLPVTAVKLSEDEVIVNAEQGDQTQKKRLGPMLRIQVDVSLGDEISFEGFGLTTRIDGKLAVSGESGQPPQAQGTLSLREGRYQAYGQDLKIQSGRLLFAGPIDNPGIDITAVRELKDVTAGIVVGGNVKSLNSRVFSEPTLPEADAFSYLLTGRPLSGGTQTSSAEMQRAAVALGLNQADVITQQLRNATGLDELTVGGDGVDQTSLFLGKQITPDIFIRYALGLFDQSGKLLLDYRLSKNISVQAETGEQQGMDVIYKIEREKLF
jgi:translocation and assembly module TamB